MLPKNEKDFCGGEYRGQTGNWTVEVSRVIATLIHHNGSGGKDSNLRLLGYEPNELPTATTPVYLEDISIFLYILTHLSVFVK